MTLSGPHRPLRYPIPRGSLGLRDGPFYPTWLGRNEGLGHRLVIGIAGAALFHGLAIGLSLTAPPLAPTPPPVAVTQSVTLEKPPPPPPPEPLPPPPPAHRVTAKPPAAAVAGQVVAVAPTPDRPLDMTGFDMVIGKGNVYAGGVTASNGTSLTAVTNVHAVPKGTGTGQARVAAPARTDWACAWPEEEQQNTELRNVRVLIQVHVDRDGDAQSVDILGPASPTFVQATRRCALNETYLSARDDSGHAIAGTTSPFSVHFFR